ncbi:MAG: zf-HC2 domain-containing protein [Planctomycetota bacterium]
MDPIATCDECLDKLPLFVGEDLEDESARRVAAHLKSCGTCRDAEERAVQARATLVDTFELEVKGGGPDLWAGVRAGLVREGVLDGSGAPAPSAPVLVGPWFRRAAGLVAAAAVVALATVPFLPSEDGGEAGLVIGLPEVEGEIDEAPKHPLEPWKDEVAGTEPQDGDEGEESGLIRIQPNDQDWLRLQFEADNPVYSATSSPTYR